MESIKNNEVVKRWKAEVPSFWKKVQRIGLLAGGIGAAILAAPVALPATIISVGGYLALAGSVTATLSQLTVENKEVLD